ncbi:similar to Kazachstania saulgensis KASA0Q03157g hypothetical protein. Pseudogene (degenerate) (Partial), partial [Maudiozyma saulgeensis]
VTSDAGSSVMSSTSGLYEGSSTVTSGVESSVMSSASGSYEGSSTVTSDAGSSIVSSTSGLYESSTTLTSVIVSSDSKSASRSTKTLTPCHSSSTVSKHPCKTHKPQPSKCACRKPWVHTRHGGWTHERPHSHC